MEDIQGIKNKNSNHLKCTLITHKLTLLEKVQLDFMNSKITMNQHKMQQRNTQNNRGNINNYHTSSVYQTYEPNNYSLSTHKNKSSLNLASPATKCIIYLHGLGSNRL